MTDILIELRRNADDYPWPWTAALCEVDDDGDTHDIERADGDTDHEALWELRSICVPARRCDTIARP